LANRFPGLSASVLLLQVSSDFGEMVEDGLEICDLTVLSSGLI